MTEEKFKPTPGPLGPVMDALANVRQASRIKGKRNFADFLADRIAQASTESTLLGFYNRLISLVDADPGLAQYHVGAVTAASSGPDALRILAWVRKYPKIAAMVASLGREDRADVVPTIALDVEPDGSGAMPARSPFDIPITVELTEPLAHGADVKAGNATLFRRMDVMTADCELMSLPFYSANAFRGQLRDSLADHFLRSLGMAPRRDAPPVAVWFFHALYAGGALEEDSNATKALNKELGAASGSLKPSGIRRLRDTIPPLSLLGCALGNRVLPGRVMICDLRPHCIEWGLGDTPAAELIAWQFLTRRDDHEGRGEDDKHAGMITATETLRAGTVLSGGIDTDGHLQDIERSALGMGLKLMAERGYLGAESRRGFGRCKIDVENLPDPQLYEDWLAEHKGEILTYLGELGAIEPPATDDGHPY